ncbi:Fur family transcriptional regulator [Desulfonatronovibrio magnus]|uniref:Fur family transcriptional regulator n=1 Tax=Desulfonatronovibrio magnus TaxID=698827 RepID=UPI0005EB443A|nr:transcriptional repressor [Desulfonatronovibrio magnus]
MKHKTRQRDAIVKCIRQSKGPMSPQEILSKAKEEVSGLGIATVYRNLRELKKEGFVREFVMPGQGARYEKSDPSLHHHHHFCCRKCDRVFCVDGCPGEFNTMVPNGFILEDHEIVLYGRCSDCRAV